MNCEKKILYRKCTMTLSLISDFFAIKKSKKENWRKNNSLKSIPKPIPSVHVGKPCTQQNIPTFSNVRNVMSVTFNIEMCFVFDPRFLRFIWRCCCLRKSKIDKQPCWFDLIHTDFTLCLGLFSRAIYKPWLLRST